MTGSLTSELTTGRVCGDALTPSARGAQSPDRARLAPTPRVVAPGQGTTDDRGRAARDARHGTAPVVPTSPQANQGTTPKAIPPAGTPTPDRATDASTPKVPTPGQGSTSPQAEPRPTPIAVTPAGIQTDDRGRARSDARSTIAPVVPLADPTLALAADILDDLERVKIANANRLRSLTRDVEDSDGEMRGFGLDPSHPDVARLAALVEMLAKAEHDATLNLQRALRKHPLGPWVKSQRGVGEKQAARLLATIGDPSINGATGQPRTVSALWAYCGLHVLPASQSWSDAQSPLAGGAQTAAGGDPNQPSYDTQGRRAGVAPRRQKGQRANWSTLAKTRAWLITEACMKQLNPDCKTDTGIANHHDDCTCSPYRIVVDTRRLHTAVTHPEWTPGHSLSDGMRVASKRLLRDLWREARRIHDNQEEPTP